MGGEKRFFPAPGDLDTEPPCIRCISLSASKFAGRLIHLAIQAMPVDRRGACVHPQTRRSLQSPERKDRKSTRLNSSHQIISYAVFSLKKKNTQQTCSFSNLPL